MTLIVLVILFIGFFTFGWALSKWRYKKMAEQDINAMRIAHDAHIDHIYKIFEENKK
jgi:uncharacterized membrane protein